MTDNIARSMSSHEPPLTDVERAARIAELQLLMNRITTEDNWVSILSLIGFRAARLQLHLENHSPETS